MSLLAIFSIIASLRAPDQEALVYDYPEIDLAIRWNYRE
jgi:hypothetical protein